MLSLLLTTSSMEGSTEATVPDGGTKRALQELAGDVGEEGDEGEFTSSPSPSSESEESSDIEPSF